MTKKNWKPFDNKQTQAMEKECAEKEAFLDEIFNKNIVKA